MIVQFTYLFYYSTNGLQIMTIETLLGTEVGRNYKFTGLGSVRDIRCQTRGAATNAADNLVTVTKKYTTGDFRGQLQSIQNPDGTVQIYLYGSNSLQKTSVVLSGQPDPLSDTNIVAGTITTTITGIGGQVLSSTSQYRAVGVADIVTG